MDDSPSSTTARLAGTAALVALVYLLSAGVSRSLATAATETLPLWLAAGVSFGALLVAAPGHRKAVLGGTAVGIYLWGMLGHGLTALAALPFAAIETAAIGIGAWLAQRGRSPAAAHRPGVAWLVAGALLTAALGATLAAEFWQWLRPGTAYGAEWRAWAYSTALSILLVAPVITAFSGFRVRRSGGMTSLQFAAGAAAFVAFAVVAWITFGPGAQQRFGALAATLAYLPMPFLLLAALLWGPAGGALAMLAGAVLLIGQTVAGNGPFVVTEAFRGESVIEVQAYVAVWAMLVLLVQDLSEARRRASSQARDWQLRYERTLQAVDVASAEFDAVTGAAFWAPQSRAVLGPGIDAVAGIDDWLACVDGADRALAQKSWRDLSSGRQAASVSDQYAVRLAGGLRMVRVRWAAVHGPDGAVERVAALVHPLPSAPADGHEADGRNHG